MSSTTTRNEESKSGTFRNHKLYHKHVNFADIINPFTFYSLMFRPIEMLIEWLMEIKLIHINMDCQKCQKQYNLSRREDKIDMFSWLCHNIKEHFDSKDFECSIILFFQHSHFTFQDIF